MTDYYPKTNLALQATLVLKLIASQHFYLCRLKSCHSCEELFQRTFNFLLLWLFTAKGCLLKYWILMLDISVWKRVSWVSEDRADFAIIYLVWTLCQNWQFGYFFFTYFKLFGYRYCTSFCPLLEVIYFKKFSNIQAVEFVLCLVTK